MTSATRVLNALLRTEKGTRLAAQANQYLFSVKKDTNKIEIKRAVEAIYKVKVVCVNTQVVPGKLKRVRHQAGQTAEWKKAFVTLKQGHKIDVA